MKRRKSRPVTPVLVVLLTRYWGRQLDRRAPSAVKAFARKYPHTMGE